MLTGAACLFWALCRQHTKWNFSGTRHPVIYVHVVVECTHVLLYLLLTDNPSNSVAVPSGDIYRMKRWAGLSCTPFTDMHDGEKCSGGARMMKWLTTNENKWQTQPVMTQWWRSNLILLQKTMEGKQGMRIKKTQKKTGWLFWRLHLIFIMSNYISLSFPGRTVISAKRCKQRLPAALRLAVGRCCFAAAVNTKPPWQTMSRTSHSAAWKCHQCADHLKLPVDNMLKGFYLCLGHCTATQGMHHTRSCNFNIDTQKKKKTCVMYSWTLVIRHACFFLSVRPSIHPSISRAVSLNGTLVVLFCGATRSGLFWFTCWIHHLKTSCWNCGLF